LYKGRGGGGGGEGVDGAPDTPHTRKDEDHLGNFNFPTSSPLNRPYASFFLLPRFHWSSSHRCSFQSHTLKNHCLS